MEGHFAKFLVRVVLPVMMIAAMGNSSILAYATESETSTVAEEIEESQLASENELGEESEEYVVDDSDSLGLDVCFYIRTNVEDSLIPDEPSDQPTTDFSDAIRVNKAVSDNSFVYDKNITCNLCDDGYTASNGVRSALLAVPSASDIQGVYPSFDPDSQYVFWYVIKTAGTPSPNTDVFLHVDGIILSKSAEPLEPEDPSNPEIPVNPGEPVEEKVKSDLEFEIFSANVEPPFEYDGEEHLIGGYIIRVTDKENGVTADYTYGPYGDFRGAVEKPSLLFGSRKSPGTTFNYAGAAFTVNVDSAYLIVKNPGNYEIPLFFGDKEVSAADIIIRDESGRILDAGVVVQTPVVDNAVSQRNITITAGSTVQNDNGKTLTNGNVTVTSGSLLPGHRLVTSIVGSQTGPGESANEITYYDIVDSEGNSYKDMYAVTRENGRLVLVKTAQSSAGAGDTKESTVQSTSADNETASTTTGSAVVLGVQRNGDGSTGLLTKDGTAAENGIAVASDGTEGGEVSDGTPQVLGARRSETSDISMPAELRIVLIVFCLMALMAINIKKSNN
jgi:hypothetical protein